MGETTYNALLNGWALSIPLVCYIITCILLSTAMRGVHCIFKALSPGLGPDGEEDKEVESMAFGKRYWAVFKGFGEDSVKDLWLGWIIGVVEVATYPILIVTGNLPIIGGWFALKIAGSWNLWHNNPTHFNRFLVSNLMNVAIAVFITSRFVIVIHFGSYLV